MPQEIRVLRCAKCKIYQVDIVKKAKKWQCKMCGEKQSVFGEYLRGTGAECRHRAQELNLKTNMEKEEIENEYINILESNDLDIDFDHLAREERRHSAIKAVKSSENKWNKYLDSPQTSGGALETQQENISKRKIDDLFSENHDYSKCPKTSRLMNTR